MIEKARTKHAEERCKKYIQEAKDLLRQDCDQHKQPKKRSLVQLANQARRDLQYETNGNESETDRRIKKQHKVT